MIPRDDGSMEIIDNDHFERPAADNSRRERNLRRKYYKTNINFTMNNI